jgi:flagellar biosynthesis/type III secretory pathway M-ring protein FliF/YscJ
MNADPTSLDRLHDVVAPPAAPWWPPAPAWDWLLAAAVLALILLAALALRHWLRNRYRHEALLELARLEAAQQPEFLEGLAELLKRAALSAWPREEVASLTGPEWLAFLDRSGANSKFATGLGPELERAAYDPRVAATMDEARRRELAALVRDWLTRHQVSASSA